MKGTEAEQRALAAAHLEGMCLKSSTIKRRTKASKPPPQAQQAPNLRQSARRPPSFHAEKKDGRANNKRPSTASYARKSLGLLKTLEGLKEESSADKATICKMQEHIISMQTMIAPDHKVTQFQKTAYKPVVLLFEDGHNNLQHYQKNIKLFHEKLNEITKCNTTMNQELIMGIGLKHKIQMFDPKNAAHAGHQDVAIVDSLVEYYKMLKLDNNKDQRGTSNFARVCLDNLNNVLALATKKHGCTERGIAARVEGSKKDRGCRSLIRLGIQRMELYDSQNLKEALVRFRRGLRSDRLKPEWEAFAAEYWEHEDVSRKSEISKRVVNNPIKTKALRGRWEEDHYRLQYLYQPIQQEYKMMVAAAAARAAEDKEKFPLVKSVFEGFHLSSTRNSELRPFFIRKCPDMQCLQITQIGVAGDACIESCLCIYHLKFMQATMVRSLHGLEVVLTCPCCLFKDFYNFRRLLRSSGACKCEGALEYRFAGDLWHVLLCDKEPGSRVYPRECVANNCSKCSGAKKLASKVLCPCIGDYAVTQMKWKKYVKIDTKKTRIAREDGHESKVFRWDFKPQESPTNADATSFQTFLDYFQNELWPEFVEHHDNALWQDYDWQMQRKNMPRGVCVTVEDFPENYTHLQKREPQSAYWMQIQSGMYVLVAQVAQHSTMPHPTEPVVLQFHIDDCDNIEEDEKEALRKVFNENDEPHFINETHVVISPDTQHGFAMVQHFREHIFSPYLKKNMPNVERCHCRSDGCRAQYKGRHHFGFISSHGADGIGVPMDWSWFCSCHGVSKPPCSAAWCLPHCVRAEVPL